MRAWLDVEIDADDGAPGVAVLVSRDLLTERPHAHRICCDWRDDRQDDDLAGLQRPRPSGDLYRRGSLRQPDCRERDDDGTYHLSIVADSVLSETGKYSP